jgi:tetratricopeptide (TPR) repeat protein
MRHALVSATSLTKRGIARAEKGEYDLAIPDYDEAIKLDPNFTLDGGHCQQE